MQVRQTRTLGLFKKSDKLQERCVPITWVRQHHHITEECGLPASTCEPVSQGSGHIPQKARDSAPLSAFFPSSVFLPFFPQHTLCMSKSVDYKVQKLESSLQSEMKENKSSQDTSLALDCNMEINYKEKTENDWFNWTHYLGDSCSFSDPLSPHFTFHSSKTQSIRKPKPVLAPPFSWWPTSPGDDLPRTQMIEQSHKTLPIAPNKLHQELQPTCFHQWATKLFSSQKAEFIL